MCSIAAGLTALSGYATYKQQQQAAESQAAAYRSQAETAQQNAAIEGRKVEQQVDNYATQQSDLRSRRRLSEGAQRAQAGSAGIDFTGSMNDLLSSSNDMYQRDQNTLLSNERNTTYDTKVTQANYLTQANAYNAAARNTEEQAKTAGLVTLLGTAASIAGGMSNTAASSGNNFASGFTNHNHGNLFAYNNKT